MIHDHSHLARAARSGSREALAELFDAYRPRLAQVIALRLDRRLNGRVDVDDVIQEAFLDALQKLPRYAEQEDFPPYLWLRLVVVEKLLQLHRRHLGAQFRDAGREISLHDGVLPASSAVLAEQLAASSTSPSHAAIRSEAKAQVESALNQLAPLDREILTLRNFELLSNAETARLLNLSPQATSNRYVRALRRMKVALDAVRGPSG